MVMAAIPSTQHVHLHQLERSHEGKEKLRVTAETASALVTAILWQQAAATAAIYVLAGAASLKAPQAAQIAPIVDRALSSFLESRKATPSFQMQQALVTQQHQAQGRSSDHIDRLNDLQRQLKREEADAKRATFGG